MHHFQDTAAYYTPTYDMLLFSSSPHAEQLLFTHKQEVQPFQIGHIQGEWTEDHDGTEHSATWEINGQHYWMTLIVFNPTPRPDPNADLERILESLQ